jgi:hypothetical protein
MFLDNDTIQINDNKLRNNHVGLYVSFHSTLKPVKPYNCTNVIKHRITLRIENLLLLIYNMFWTLELASHLEDAPWPATKDELIDYAIRSGAPLEVVENLQELDDEGEIYEGIEDIWPDYPTQEDFFFNEDEY